MWPILQFPEKILNGNFILYAVHPEVELWLFENYSLSPSMWSSKNSRAYSKKCAKIFNGFNIYGFNGNIWLINIKMKIKMKKRSHRYDINGPKARNGNKYIKHKKFCKMIMLICIKQLLSNIWSSVHEKVKEAELKKKRTL